MMERKDKQEANAEADKMHNYKPKEKSAAATEVFPEEEEEQDGETIMTPIIDQDELSKSKSAKWERVAQASKFNSGKTEQFEQQGRKRALQFLDIIDSKSQETQDEEENKDKPKFNKLMKNLRAKKVNKITLPFTAEDPILDKQEVDVLSELEEHDTTEPIVATGAESTAPTKKIRSKENPLDIHILGYRSELYGRKQGFLSKMSSGSPILESDSEMKDTVDNEKDMTWLFSLSEVERSRSLKWNKPSIFVEHTTDWKSSVTFAWLLWIFLLIGGRMPFHFVEKFDSSGKGAIKFIVDKRGKNFWIFIATSLILLLLTAICMISFFGIWLDDIGNGDNLHTDVSQRLFHQNWSTAFIFLVTLTLASVSSINVLLNGDRFADYITHWEKNLDEMNFDASPRILRVTITFIVLVGIHTAMQFVLFFWTKSQAITNPFIGGVHLITYVIFEPFVPNILDSPNRDTFAAIAVLLNAYVLYCSWGFVIMVVVYSVGITNLASEWNFRLRVLLAEINVKRNEIYLRRVRGSLSYANMFGWHRRIVTLIQETSKVFSTILLTFYLFLATAFGAELLSTSFYVIGTPSLLLHDQGITHYAYDRNLLNTMDTLFHIAPPILIFLIVSLYLSDAGSTTMEALTDIESHGYMLIASTHERNFIMSLIMSFGSRQPYFIKVVKLFRIDRGFIIKFIGILMFIFSVMIQTRNPKPMDIPSLYECPSGPDNICVGSQRVRLPEVEKITEMNFEHANRTRIIQPIQNDTEQGRMDLTTREPDVCIKMAAEDGTIPGNPELPKACDEHGNEIEPYPQGCLEFKFAGIQKPFLILDTSGGIFDCNNSREEIWDERDDCGNIPLYRITTNTEAIKKAVRVVSGHDVNVMCCYDYGFSNTQLEFCNQKTTHGLDQGCGINPVINSKVHPYPFALVDATLQPCILDPQLLDPDCEHVHECFCGSNPGVHVPDTSVTTWPANSITCPKDNCILKVGEGRSVGLNSTLEQHLKAKDDFGSSFDRYVDDCLVKTYTGVQKPYQFLGLGYLDLLTDGFPGSGLGDKRRDSCFNLPFYNVNTRTNALQRAIKIASKGVDYVLCCYDYGIPNNQVQLCNQNTSEAIDLACGIKPKRRNKHPYRFLDLEHALQNCLNPAATTPCTVADVDDCFCGATPSVIVPKVMATGKIRCA